LRVLLPEVARRVQGRPAPAPSDGARGFTFHGGGDDHRGTAKHGEIARKPRIGDELLHQVVGIALQRPGEKAADTERFHPDAVLTCRRVVIEELV
jgi:hypothetical protein